MVFFGDDGTAAVLASINGPPLQSDIVMISEIGAAIFIALGNAAFNHREICIINKFRFKIILFYAILHKQVIYLFVREGIYIDPVPIGSDIVQQSGHSGQEEFQRRKLFAEGKEWLKDLNDLGYCDQKSPHHRISVP